MKLQFYSGRAHGIFDIPRIFWGVLSTAFNVSWFGYRQAYWAVRLSRLFGRKSIVILGGFDVCEEEDPHFATRIREIRYVLANADRLLAVSNRVREKAEMIGAETRPIDLVYHGFDAARYRPAGQKSSTAVTVAYLDQTSVRRKGVEVFVRAARLLPDVDFVVVGGSLDGTLDHLRSIAPPNVRFAGLLPESRLIEVLQSAAVYVQPSLHEGFGCSIAEAMLCECVPVVSNRGAIPEVVGPDGVYVNPEDVEDVAQGIQSALGSPELGRRARDRITRLFPIEARRERLTRVIEELVV